MNDRELISFIQNAINSNKSELVISEFSLNEHLENELLFFSNQNALKIMIRILLKLYSIWSLINSKDLM